MSRIPTHFLRHRAEIRRIRTVFVNGTPSQQTATVANGEPVLLDTIGHEFTPSVGATATQVTEADRHGLLFVGPTSSAVWDVSVPTAEREIRPSDVLVITTGSASATVTALGAASRIEGWAGSSHREVRVKEV